MTPSLSRRRVLKGMAAGTAALAAPWVHSSGKPKLRILGTHVTLQEALRQQAMQDLGIDLQFEPKGSAAVLQKASMQPDAFDLV